MARVSDPGKVHYVYAFALPGRKEFKVGMAVDIAQREAQLFKHKRRTSAAQGVVGGSAFVLAWFIVTENREAAHVLEAHLHQRLAPYHKVGEVFHLTAESWKELMSIAEEYLL